MRVFYAVCGIVLGPVVLSLTNMLLHALVAPQLFRDGQYVFFFVFFVPEGVWMGVVTGFGLGALREADHRLSGRMLLVGSGLFVAAALGFALLCFPDPWGFLMGYCGVALLWAAGLILWALVWVTSKPPKNSPPENSPGAA